MFNVGTHVQFFSHYNSETYLFIYQFNQMRVSKKPLIGKHSYLRSYDRYNADLYLVYHVVDAVVFSNANSEPLNIGHYEIHFII